MESNDVWHLKQWAEFQINRGIDKVEFFKNKSSASYRFTAASNWQNHADQFVRAYEAFDLLQSIINFSYGRATIPGKETSLLDQGETSIKPSGMFFHFQYNWERLSLEELEKCFEYIRQCKLRYIAHQSNEKA